MSNQTLQTLPILALLVEIVVLGLRLWRGGAGPMTAVNGLAAIGLALPLGLALGQGPDSWAEGLYPAMAALFAFELVVLATSLRWVLRRDTTLGVLVWLGFSVHALLTIAALVFAFTFRIDRLF